ERNLRIVRGHEIGVGSNVLGVVTQVLLDERLAGEAIGEPDDRTRANSLDDGGGVGAHPEITFDGPLEEQLRQAAQEGAGLRRRASGCRMDVGGRSADVGNDEIPPALAIGRTLAQELAGPQNGAWRRNDLRYEPDLLCGALDALGPRDMTHEQLTDCRVHLLA